MGIPHLIQMLRPFATRVVTGNGSITESGSPDELSLIIDGPSLAHEIFRRRYASQESETRPGPLDNVLSYDTLGKKVITWLKYLERRGVKMWVSSSLFHCCCLTKSV